ncbi:MAG: DNA-methyltransferase, partial [Nanobdellota archaeon]
SPPYYNAREYSQWQNLYNYLNDMYNIISKANEKLVPGGIFFYNIGDIFDNENTIVKSKMGEKRIPLGAYIILLFQKAGFNLLDNIIWYKGEPQSNRHKNDGNYTPYYQRPANCYEHMFIFKKKGILHLNKNDKENILNSNIIKFTPVFKIFKGGENRYGHTAPFPHKIPLLSILCFTNEGEYVLDPFSGSGTSSIVANKNKRVGIGIELNKDYLELSLSKAEEESIEYDVIR